MAGAQCKAVERVDTTPIQAQRLPHELPPYSFAFLVFPPKEMREDTCSLGF